jgi:hypothetical protein
MITNPEASLPSLCALDENLKWKLSNFRPRKAIVANDPRLESFLNGAVDYNEAETPEEGTLGWTWI